MACAFNNTYILDVPESRITSLWGGIGSFSDHFKNSLTRYLISYHKLHFLGQCFPTCGSQPQRGHTVILGGHTSPYMCCYFYVPSRQF